MLTFIRNCQTDPKVLSHCFNLYFQDDKWCCSSFQGVNGHYHLLMWNSSQVFCPCFKNCLFYTLLSICGSSLYILDMVTFSDGFIANAFSQSVAWLFIFLRLISKGKTQLVQPVKKRDFRQYITYIDSIIKEIKGATTPGPFSHKTTPKQNGLDD